MQSAYFDMPSNELACLGLHLIPDEIMANTLPLKTSLCTSHKATKEGFETLASKPMPAKAKAGFKKMVLPVVNLPDTPSQLYHLSRGGVR